MEQKWIHIRNLQIAGIAVIERPPLEFKKTQFDSPAFLREEFVRIDAEKRRKEINKIDLLNQYRIEHNKEQELLRLAEIEMKLEKEANENKARQKENNARQLKKEAEEEANALERLRENNFQKKEISKKKEYISTVTRYHPDKFVKSESVYDTLKAEFTEFNNISFDDFLIMFNHDQLSDIYNDEFNTNEMILFYLNYFSGIYYETKHELYNSVYNIVNTYKEYIKLNRLGRIEKKLHQSRV